MNGWIKLHRQLLENPVIMKDADHLAIWTWLLLNATHDDYDGFFGGRRVTLKAGEFITGRKKIAACLNISESKVQRVLACFESEQQIEQRTDRQSRIIKLKNWHKYQESEQRVNNDRTTTEQRVNTEQEQKNRRTEETTTVDPRTTGLMDYIDSECRQSGVKNAVNARAFDIQVRRYINLPLKVEIRKCLTWLIEHNQKQITASRLANWFAKAQEIQKRDEGRRLERLQASKDPIVAAQVRARGEKPEQPEMFMIDPAVRARLKSLSPKSNG
jgi:hypothetical protein